MGGLIFCIQVSSACLPPVMLSVRCVLNHSAPPSRIFLENNCPCKILRV